MARTDISFLTSDGVTLRGWFFQPETRSNNQNLPCLVMAHGFTCVKEMGLEEVASRMSSALPLTCLVFDYRGFGSSDCLPGQPRQEVIAAVQCSDLRDAITFAQTKDGVDRDKIGLWGYSFGGGHVVYLGAVDRRVKAVISLAPMTDGWENFLRLARPDLVQQLNQGFEIDRISRAAGNPPMTLPVVSANPHGPSALPSPESHQYFSAWEHEKSTWKNELTLRSVEDLRAYTLPFSHLEHTTPTPVFMAINTRDTNTPPDIGMRAFAKLSEPKELCIVEANHYEMLGSSLDSWHEKQVAFLKRMLCKA